MQIEEYKAWIRVLIQLEWPALYYPWQELTTALAEAEKNATQLEEALAHSSNITTEQRQKIESLTEELNDAYSKVKSLDREGGRLRNELAALELRVHIFRPFVCFLFSSNIYPYIQHHWSVNRSHSVGLVTSTPK